MCEKGDQCWLVVKLPYLCLGTVKSARTSFLLLDLVFMFMQKSMAACRGQERGQDKGQVSLMTCDHVHCACAHLVYEVSVDTVGQLLDEGVHDELHVGASVGLLVLLF